jgi:hypothetical protein
MKASFLFKSLWLIGAGSLLATGCVTRERVVYRQAPPPVYVATAPPQEVVVTEAPPPVIVESRTSAPGSGFIWIGGAWVWRGHWVWEHGRWARPPHPGYVWRPHHYEYRNGVHIFVGGGWHN